MKRNIRIIVYLMILIMVISNLISCENTAGLSSQSSSEAERLLSSQSHAQLSSESSKPDISGKGDLWADKRLRVGYIGQGADGNWYTTVHNKLKDSAQQFNVNLTFYDGQGKQELQKEYLLELIEEDVDIIGITVATSQGWDEIFTKVKEAGIPIILIGKAIDSNNEALWDAIITPDYRNEEQMVGEWLINYLKKNNKLEEQYSFVELTGTTGATITLERDKGFSEIINSYNNIEKIYSKNCDFSTKLAYNAMSNILQETTDIDILFCHNDYMSLGAIQAIEEAGLVPGEDIIIISIEGTNAALKAIVEGKIACSVECNPMMGDLFMEACVRLANGETIEREIHPVDRVFDITNAQAEIDYRKLKGYGY